MARDLALNEQSRFVLCDDASAVGSSRLYIDPIDWITTSRLSEIPDAIGRMRTALAEGRRLAGYLSYEAGLAFEPLALKCEATGLAQNSTPLLSFGVFKDWVEPPPLRQRAEAFLGQPVPAIDFETYESRVKQVLDYIQAGHIYQANLTFPTTASMTGAPLDLYCGLRARQLAAWGGIVRTEDHWLMSWSPELFFQLRNGQVTARPMKGTARRQPDPVADGEARLLLAKDPKERAENLMIVDLLRNDLSRVCQPGTVVTPRLFEIETYPTVHQMTSTVEGRLTLGLGVIDLLTTIFPCGSITGAPKIRAMQIIAELENGARGPYTGSMGFIDPNGDATFNVMIRTAEHREGAGSLRLCVGSGIVADSVPDAEWRECHDKLRFAWS